MITILNSIFDAKGADKKSKVYGITLNGTEDITIKNCEFKNIGYSSILNNSTNSVIVEGCKFDCSNVYNPIEGSQSSSNGNLTVHDCAFNGAPGTNYINTYQFKEGCKITIDNCSFEPTVDNNIIRVSNKTNSTVNILVNNCDYKYSDGVANEYTNLLLCQDFTKKSGNKQDFTKVNVTLNNVRCNGVKLEEDVIPEMGGIYYVYEDGKGIITGMGNDPIVTIK